MSSADQLIETLRGNGYFAHEDTTGSEPVAVIRGAEPRHHYADGVTRETSRVVLPEVQLAMLRFEIDEPTKLSSKFARDLVELIAPKGITSAPIIRITERTVEAIYRHERGGVGLTDASGGERWPNGLRFADITNQYSRRAQLRADACDVQVDGRWLNGRSPITVRRDELPRWDADAITKDLIALVERHGARGSLRVEGGYSGSGEENVRDASRPTYSDDIDIKTPPSDWDPADPRRKVPGFFERVRKLRRAAGLDKTPAPAVPAVAASSSEAWAEFGDYLERSRGG